MPTRRLPNHTDRVALLHEAASTGDVELLRLLVELGADPDLRDPSYDATPLGWAEHHHETGAAAYSPRSRRPALATRMARPRATARRNRKLTGREE